MRAAHVDNLIAFYESMSTSTVANIGDIYAVDAYFKDPFNEFEGIDRIEEIFRRMFRQVDEPRFVVQQWTGEDDEGFVVWDLHFRSRLMRGGPSQKIHGVTQIRFDATGKVTYHRDYWDTGEELYAKLPLIGWLIRRLRKYAG